uniref:Ubiquitin conjugation factor E4 A n=2 Tax=Schistosoma mansoni TaxID=6183 RepID=A0A3Q0KDX8_SCHMA
MDSADNPFASLVKNSSVGLGPAIFGACETEVTKILENILLITHDKDLVFGESGRPSHLLYIQPFSCGNVHISGSSLDELIFDRTQMRKFNDYDVVSINTGAATDINDVLASNPISYLVSSYHRACVIKQTNALSQIVEDCRKSIVRQIVLLLLVDAESDNPESSTNLFDIVYQALCTDDCDQIAYIQKMFDEVLSHLVSESLSDVSILESCPQSALNSLRPLVNRLLIQLRNIYYSSVQSPTVVNSFLNKQLVGARERVLFCPQRRPLLIMTIWLSKYAVTAQLLIELSFPQNFSSGSFRPDEFEGGLLGRLLVSSHLHSPQAAETIFLTNQAPIGEFFTEEVPLKSVVESEQRTIWQLTEQMDLELNTLFTNLLRVGKRRPYIKKLLFKWFGGCIHANKARGQLAHSIMNHDLLSRSNTPTLAGDGFLSNFTAVLVRLTGPLVTLPEKPPLDKIWPEYATDSCTDRTVLPDLRGETRLAPANNNFKKSENTSLAVTNDEDYPLLTELFFLAHAAIRIGWTSLIARHFETGQQLHRLEDQLQPHESDNSNDSQVIFLRRFMRERTARYLEQSTSLSCMSRLKDQLSFAVTTCRLLVKLANDILNKNSSDSSNITTSTSDSTPFSHGCLSDLPEYLVDNVVELVSYLRRGKDEFLESVEVSSIPLEPLLEFSIIFMSHTGLLTNPHLRARLAEVLESLVPQRDDEAWNTNTSGSGLLNSLNLSFHRREQLMNRDPEITNDPILSNAVRALLTAFVSIELSPGTGVVGSAGSAADAAIAASSSSTSQNSSSHQPGSHLNSSDSQTDIGNNSSSTSSSNNGGNSATDTQTAAVGFEEKFHYRRPMYACLRYWYGKPLYDVQFKRLENEALAHIDDVNPPLFLQFLSLLVNDAIFLLDEALSLLAQLKQTERERDKCGGRLSSSSDEALFAHTGRLARHHIMLGLDTIATLRRVITLCSQLITHPILVDRVACMLNYFLTRLVGPKQRDLNVRDKAAYGFKPDIMVLEISAIYQILARGSDSAVETDAETIATSSSSLPSSSESFRRAVVSDERSFTPDLLDQACRVLDRIAAPIDLCNKFAEAVRLIKAENVIKTNEELDVDDAPDEFIDPIMGCLMEDPVKLPTSGHIVDRKTIYRHLLNDSTDPFSRQPLTMSQVEPQENLRSAVRKWIDERRAQRLSKNTQGNEQKSS